MLTVVRDAQGRLEAACEWWLVDAQGHLNWEYGRYVYADQVECGEGVSMFRAIREFAPLIMRKVPQAIGIYWEREDTGTRLHAFRKDQFQKELVYAGK